MKAQRMGRLALLLALACIIGPGEAQAGRYGVNQTITHNSTISSCSIVPFSCSSHCDSKLASKCQSVAASFCLAGDTLVSATFGGTYPAPATSCSVTSTKPSPLCFSTQYFNLGTANCSGSCNALCEENFYFECFDVQDCVDLYGVPEFGTWECRFNQCILNNSPLVLHLPDYYSNGGGGGSQNWWKKGFCGPETPTVCLDWTGDGNPTCSAWLEPGSEIAFVVALSNEDMFHLLDWEPVRAEPWRHFFGNVTQGPGGDHPYEHGFAALANYCGQDPALVSEIDLTQCGGSLFTWDDRNVDGNIEIHELLELQDLGITALGDVRQTGKKDKCGNTFRVESNAICSHGKCGTVLDVFFQSR